MKRHLSAVPILVLALFSHRARAADASPEDSAQAVKELIKTGSAEYTKQHWEAARVAFLKAWELKQHYAIAANLADVDLKLGRYREAAQLLKYTLANLPPERANKRSDAEASLKECRTHLSSVRLSVSVAGATVQLDGQTLPPEALTDELLLDPGLHRLEAQKSGFSTSSREFSAVAGEAREIRIDLAPQPLSPAPGAQDTSRLSAAAPAANTSDSGTTAPLSPRTWVLIGGGAATVVATGLGVFFTLRQSTLKSDSEKLEAQAKAEGSPPDAAVDGECRSDAPMRPVATCAQLSQTVDSRITARNLAIGSWIAAGALGAATVATYFLWPAKQGEHAHEKARLSVTPWLVGVRGGAFQVDF